MSAALASRWASIQPRPVPHSLFVLTKSTGTTFGGKGINRKQARALTWAPEREKTRPMLNTSIFKFMTATLALGLFLTAGTAQAKDPPIIMGAGSHTYEWVPGWIKLPPGMNIGKTHGDVVIDAKDRIFFATDSTNTLYQVDVDGRVQKVFGYAFEAGAHGLRLVKDGDREVIWITHLGRHEVIKISLEGDELMTIPFPNKNNMYKEAKEFLPTAVDVAPNGDVYVVDGYGKNWLHRFSRTGMHVQSWNGSEGAAGPLKQPHGVGIDLRNAEPRVVVADRQNHRLQLFTLDGKYIDKVEEELRLPSKVVFRGDDMMIIDLKGRVTIFDKQNKVITQLGDNADPALRGNYNVSPDKWKDGQFTSPHGGAWDSKGNLYVEDWNSFGRISKLKRVKAKVAKPAK